MFMYYYYYDYDYVYVYEKALNYYRRDPSSYLCKLSNTQIPSQLIIYFVLLLTSVPLAS